FGVPQLVQSRGAFGYLGNFLPAGLNALTAGIGWFAVNTISGTFALSTLTHLPFQITLIFIVLLQVFVAFIGHNFIHQFEKVAFPYLAIVFTIATVVILAQSNPGVGFNPKAPVAFGGASAAFILSLFISFAYAAGWAPYSMDFARYLPPGVRSQSVFWNAMLGVFLPCAILEIGGAALATVAGTAWGPTDSPTDQLVKPLPGILAGLTLLGIALGAVSANVLNIYSGAMSFLALGIRVGGLRRQRALVAVLFGAVGYLVARSGEVDAGHAYENFLLLIGYWITPFLGVVLTDYWIRRGRYDEREFFSRRHNTYSGLVAMAAGIIVSVPFWNQTLWHGPVVDALPQLGDLSFIVGFVVAGGVYYALAAKSATQAAAAAVAASTSSA
ncbi:MAG TPA: cytosine permease, partial [Chloroflexota bacterium]|nr:cytosine permease [Chloroflexota bacterium]